MVLVRTNAYRQLLNGKVREKERMSLTEMELTGYGEKFRKAQKATRGQILTYDGEPILASYHKISAGQTRNGSEVFHSDQYPYLSSKACPGDKDAPDYRQSIQIDDSWRDMEIEEKDSTGFVITSGIGHGLGMSQYTAQQLAKNGTGYQEILAYFFDKTRLEHISDR